MNEYVLALIGLLVLFVVGVICYGVLFKGFVGEENAVKLSVPRFLVAGVGMYVMALAFIMLYKKVDLGDMSNVMKGLELGLWLGVPFFLIPLFADAPYFKGKANIEWAVIINWVLGLAVLGVVVGALI
jgi:hypothetical protein